ncbi:transporter substrate-binding domain-containing protein [Brachybacterium sacelli]|uniref:ABC-type amino acid transport substrate-binding protein n=2 Tax=Brachybacterium sacelli TaxID=173364 RepID=A0ABS4X5A8_9MICO|nr:transporter substrate-binding domain-containing protein [Brachybacterium sacelli]MBP2383645.1 ABC-type amino acid transport substrate-binding protein [Brachybacterium sacelli]
MIAVVALRTPRSILLVLAMMLVLVTAGCQGHFPADSQGTLDRARDGVLRVGISENDPFTEVAPDGSVSGSEVDLIREYAASIDAEVDWQPGGENALAASMKAGDLDVVIGGLASDAPWTSKIALTRPYTSTTGPEGKTVKIVMGVTPGENALLVDLERFLAEEAGDL